MTPPIRARVVVVVEALPRRWRAARVERWTLRGAAMEERAVPAVGRRARTPATFIVVDMSRACARVECRGADGHERLWRCFVAL